MTLNHTRPEGNILNVIIDVQLADTNAATPERVLLAPSSKERCAVAVPRIVLLGVDSGGSVACRVLLTFDAVENDLHVMYVPLGFLP